MKREQDYDACAEPSSTTTDSVSPPAKRVDTKQGDSNMQLQSSDEDSDDALIMRQRQAIWARMQEYKTRYQESCDKLDELNNHVRRSRQTSHLVQEVLIMLTENLSAFTKAESFEEVVVDQGIYDLVTRRLALDEVVVQRRDYYQSIEQTIARIFARLRATLTSGAGSSLDALKAERLELSTQKSTTEHRLSLRTEELQKLKQDLEEAVHLKEKLQKSVNRLKAASLLQPAGSVSGPGAKCESPTKSDDPDGTLLAQRRLEEIEGLRAEKIQLIQQLDQLQIQSSIAYNDERIRDSPAFQNLLSELDYQRNENALLKNRLDRLTVEYEELQADRRKFFEQVETEEAAKRKVLEGELRKLGDDLTRIRGNRDQLQQSLDLVASRDEAERLQNEEIKMIANSRRDRIVALENKIDRIKLKTAAELSDSFLLEFFNQDPTGNPLEHLQTKLRESETKVEQLSRELESMVQSQGGRTDLQQALYREKELQAKIVKLQEQIMKMESAGSPQSLQARLQEMEQRIEYYQKSEARLIGEIDSIGKAWAELEKQSLKKVLNLTEKEDHIMKLLAEKVKFEQKISMLTKQGTTAANLTLALKRQSEKQLEQIRKLEDREKNLQQQLATVEKELSSKCLSVDVYRRKVAELTQRNTDVQERLEKVQARLSEAERVLRERTKTAVEEEDTRKRLAEQLEIAKRKLESVSRVDSYSDSGLAKEVESYKLLLKCSSCTSRFKSHVLLRCMHTFCKECLDDLVNSRQRKCPKCGLAFSQGDVKEIYL